VPIELSATVACLVWSLLLKITFRLFLVSVFLLISLAPAMSYAAASCGSCHAEVKNKGRRGRFIHQPFLAGKCAQCHIAGKAVSAPVKKSPLAVEKQQLKKIRWFQTVTGRESEHWLRLPADKLTGGLYLKATDGRTRSPLQKITLPRGGALPQMQDDRQPPQLSNLQVLDVRRGISTTVTLHWETDEYTDSVIHYGVGNLRSVTTDRQLARQHNKVLLGLDAGKSYQFQIISRDLFGNETKSPVVKFSTEKSFWNQDANYNADRSISTAIKLRWQLYRIAGDYLLVVKADRPVVLSLGAAIVPKNRNTVERQVAATGSFSHPILKSSLDTNVTVCKTCHQSLQEEYSHPIRVRARKGMIIPSEYPVLPDGTLSCMTCHDSHASNYEYRLRKSSKADLCRGCHRNY